MANAPQVFAGDVPQIGVFDDLYHFKRMAFTAAHFPRLLDFDSDRGERGAFCPWPPLYDYAAGATAWLLGARAPAEVLRHVVWLAPLVAALFIAVVAALVTRKFGWDAGAAIAIALSFSKPLIVESSIGELDHHFLEAPLVFGILGATVWAFRRGRLAGVWLGLALTIALFVRTALLIPAALAFFALFAFTDGLAAATGFGIAAVAVSLYRLSRPPGYPDQEWFLGWSHAALLGAAAVAGAVLYWRGRRRWLFALLCGSAVVFATPSAPGSILFGSEYISGNAWFRTIAEGVSIWTIGFGTRMAFLSTGTILVWLLLALAIRRRDAILGIVAGFGIVELLLTLRTVRYWSLSIPLLALAGTLYATWLPARWRRTVLALVALPVLIQFGIEVRNPVGPVIGEGELPWIRAANVLRNQPGSGRVLAPWYFGHAIDVIGGRPVVIDNFGIMSDEVSFDRAYDAFLQLDEEALWSYCRAAGIRWVILDNPAYGLQAAAATLDLDRARYVRTNSENEPVAASRLSACSWWWRAYYEHGAASPWRGMFGRPFRRFRLVYTDPQPSWRGSPTLRGPALQIWERLP